MSYPKQPEYNNGANAPPPPYGFQPPQAAPPSYSQAMGGVPPTSPFTAAKPRELIYICTFYTFIETSYI